MFMINFMDVVMVVITAVDVMIVFMRMIEIHVLTEIDGAVKVIETKENDAVVVMMIIVAVDTIKKHIKNF